MMYVAGHSTVASSRLSGSLLSRFIPGNSYCTIVLEMLQVSNNYWLF